MRTTLTLLVAAALAACQSPTGTVSKEEGGGGAVELTGAGATFPYPLYSKWVSEYQKAHPEVRINYQSIGSGGGIRQITERTVDFGATDAPMTDAELARAPGKLLHIPTTLGAVVVTYNVPGVATGLNLSPDVIDRIFRGEIVRWNDARIVQLNAGVQLPDTAISVVYRSDGSGTTAVFTEYLAAVSPAWKDQVGAGKSVRFPRGLGAKGNEGVAGQVKTTPGAIGYVELAYAAQTHQPYAKVRNRAGQMVEPTTNAISAAAAGADLPADLRVSIVDAPGQGAYPIAAFTYILVYQQQPNAREGKALVDFLGWAIHDGQSFAESLHYAPLPDAVVEKVDAQLATITANGEPLVEGGRAAATQGGDRRRPVPRSGRRPWRDAQRSDLEPGRRRSPPEQT